MCFIVIITSFMAFLLLRASHDMCTLMNDPKPVVYDSIYFYNLKTLQFGYWLGILLGKC